MKKKTELLHIYVSMWLVVMNVVAFSTMAQPEESQDTKNGYFTVWINSYQDVLKAEFEKGLYGDLGQPVSVVEVDLKDKGVWYRTYIGRFPSKQEALQFGNHLQKILNIKWFKVLYHE